MKLHDTNYSGPVELTVSGKPVKDMSKEEYKANKTIHDREAELNRKGHNRKNKNRLNWLGQLLARAKAKGPTFF